MKEMFCFTYFMSVVVKTTAFQFLIFVLFKWLFRLISVSKEAYAWKSIDSRPSVCSKQSRGTTRFKYKPQLLETM